MRREIVVGLDDSPSGSAALQWAADEARRRHVGLRALHALSWPFGARTDPPLSPLLGLSLDEVDAIYRASITRVFDSIRPQPDWLLQFARGDAGPVLVRQSRFALALVIGAPNHVGLGRLVAGSVAHYCLSHAQCPVVAVPPPLPSPADGTPTSRGGCGQVGRDNR